MGIMPAVLQVSDADRSVVSSYVKTHGHLGKRQIARRIESANALPGRSFYGIYSLVRKATIGTTAAAPVAAKVEKKEEPYVARC